MLSDVKFAIRTLLKNPAFTLTCIGILGLGIGATTAVFSVVNSVLLRPLPFPESDRLVSVWNSAPKTENRKRKTENLLALTLTLIAWSPISNSLSAL